MTLLATAALLFGVGAGYLYLLGTAVSRRRAAPALAAPGPPDSALPGLGGAGGGGLPAQRRPAVPGGGGRAGRAGGADRGAGRLAGALAVVAGGRCAEALPPWLLGLASYLVAVLVHARQGALSALVVDSDVEHFPDVISALLHYPIGPEVVAQQGLEATPVGLAYHYVHASLSALGGRRRLRHGPPGALPDAGPGRERGLRLRPQLHGPGPAAGRCWRRCSTPGGPCPWWWPPSAGGSRRRRWPRCRWPWLPCAWG